MHKEKLSVFMDGEAADKDLLSLLSSDTKLQQSWQSYHLIRDTLRGDIQPTMRFDIADRVAAALASQPVRLLATAARESQPLPEIWHKLPFWRKLSPWVSQMAQVGVSACVSLAIIIGVQHYSDTNSASSSLETPAFNTLPMIGRASPVSFGVLNEVGLTSEPKNIQEQRRRINAILQDYELQRRLQTDQPQLQPPTRQQAAFQIAGKQSTASRTQTQ